MLVYLVFITFILTLIGCATFCDDFDMIHGALIAALFFGLFTVLTVIGIESGELKLDHEERAYEIVSLKSKSEISGSFFLGTGSIDDREYYYTFAEVEEDRYKRVTIPSDNSIIEETDEKTPHVTKKYYVRDGVDWIVPEWIDKGEVSKVEYNIYVPKGTIIKEFSVK